MTDHPTHAAIIGEVRENRAVSAQALALGDHLMRRMDEQSHHNALVLTSLKQLFQKAEDTEVSVGEIHAKVLRYDLMGASAKAWLVGVMGTAAIAWMSIWYLIGDKVDTFFGKQP